MAKHAFPMHSIRSGERYESDIFLGREFLLRQGHPVTPELFIRLKRRGVKELTTPLESLAVRMRERVGALPALHREKLAERRDALLAEAGVESAVPHEIYDRAVAASAAAFLDAANGTLTDFSPLFNCANELAERVKFTGGEVYKPLDTPSPDLYYTRHGVNVAVLLLSVMDGAAEEVGKAQVAMGGLLHDIGKAHVPGTILFKQGALSEDEWNAVRDHVSHSMKHLAAAIEVAPEIRGMIEGHHEKWNGTGYPAGKAGEDIPALARWLTCCDVYDALTTTRAHQGRVAPPIALELLLQSAGSHFDPDVAGKISLRLGTYPVGSYLLLDVDRTALVVRNFPGDAPDRPEVVPVTFDGGEPRAGARFRISGRSEVSDIIDV
ncbi:MAG: HD domain-containing protein [bacterium]|jgi:HD-GYP domain-containing protein (c-di-GMP phosphodiesterase class II)